MVSLNQWYSSIGKLGGSSKSLRKRAASIKNGSRQKPHFKKVAHFKKVFPHPLHCNEWLVKWPIKHRFGKTYNPDFWCPELECFIEVATSIPNISSEQAKWRKALKRGYKLQVFWWEGQNITRQIKNPKHTLWSKQFRQKPSS